MNKKWPLARLLADFGNVSCISAEESLIIFCAKLA